jgi:hypothetical protein
LGSFQFLAIVNNGAMNIGVQLNHFMVYEVLLLMVGFVFKRMQWKDLRCWDKCLYAIKTGVSDAPCDPEYACGGVALGLTYRPGQNIT